MKKERQLPNNWVETAFGEITDYVTSGSRDWSKYYSDQGALFIRTQDINTNRLLLDDAAHVSLPAKVEGKRTRVYKGDILITITGANVGKVALVDHEIKEAYVSQSIALVRLKEKSRGKFLHYQLMTRAGGDKTHLESMAYGLGRPVLNLDNIRDVPVRLAPLDQQNRIVAEIEKQFSRLDEAVACLKRVRANLKRYKAAVLKAAVEGKLTEDWRKQHPDVEPASKLLERILAERRAKWHGRTKYKEPVHPNSSFVPTLPDRWVLATAEQCTSVITDGEHITPRRSDSGVLLLSARNVLDGRLSLADVDYVPRSEYDRIAKRLVINPGDVLLSCSGTVGRSTVAPEKLEFTLVRSVAVLKPFAEMGKYLSIALRSPILQEQVSEKKTQTAQSNIFQGKIKTLVFSLPPLAEQHLIVAEVERRLSVIEELEVAVEVNLKRAERFRQSVLQKAFSGR